MTQHSRLFSPSASERWLTCTESPYLNLEDRPAGSHAHEGSAAHKLGELVLAEGGSCESWIGKEIDVYEDGSLIWTVDNEMAYFVQDYVDYCTDQIDPLGTSEVETRFDLTHLGPGMFGTGDFCAISDEELVIVDLKYGKGVKVYGIENTQLKLYALGAIEQFGMLYDFEKVRTVVFQPRLEWISECEYDLTDLELWGESVKAVTDQIANKRNLTRVASEKGCKWCAAKGSCGVFAELATSQARDAFTDVGFEPTKPTMTDEDKAKALESIPLLKTWIKAMEEESLTFIEQGGTIPGWKVVEGRSQRKYSDELAVLEICKKAKGIREDAYTNKSLLSVAQLEKSIKKANPTAWARVEKHITKPPGKHTLVPESDKRESIGTPADQFKDIETEDPLN